MLLKNINIIAQESVSNVKIEGGKIEAITSTDEKTIQQTNDISIQFQDAIAFPGLINSHDHLDFNLFPRLGSKKYNNYLEWGPDIHRENKNIINEILKIPRPLRFMWGAYKNLLCGVTTVAHHGSSVNLQNAPVNLIENCCSLHSIRLEKNWRLKLNNPFIKPSSFVIHIGEGVDESMRMEADILRQNNFFKRKLIGVHGISVSKEQARLFDAMIWCPDSNIFLYGETARMEELRKVTQIIFGSDSTLSSHWNIYEHIRLAVKMNILSAEEIYHSLTYVPAKVWGLKGKGNLSANKIADIVIAKTKDNKSGFEQFLNVNPEDILLVMREGEIVLADEEIAKQIKQKVLWQRFSNVYVNGACKKVLGNVPALVEAIKGYCRSIELPIEI